MLDFTREGGSGDLESVDLTENEKFVGPNLVMTKTDAFSVGCEKVVANLQSCPACYTVNSNKEES